MGCGQSNFTPADIEEQIEELRVAIHETHKRSNEKKNIMRYKTEVLVNMLATEEKKTEVLHKRIDTIRFILNQEDLNEEKVKLMVSKRNSDVASSRESLSSSSASPNLQIGSPSWDFSANLNTGFDLQVALEKMANEFLMNKKDVFYCFADEEGKIEPSLNIENFCKRLNTVTEFLTKIEIQAIALRFCEENNLVSIPEFLNFFLISSEVSNMKFIQ